MLKKTLLFLIVLLMLLSATVFFALSDRSSIARDQGVSAQDIQSAKLLSKQLMRQLSTASQNVTIEISDQQLTSLATLASHLTPNTDFVFNLSNPVVLINISTQIAYAGLNKYLNLNCMLLPDGYALAFENCRLGQVPLPNSLMKFMLDKGLTVVLGAESSSKFVTMLDRAEISNHGLTFNVPSAINLKQQIKTSMSKVTSITTYLADHQSVDAEVLEVYIEQLNQLNGQGASLSPYVSSAFKLANMRSAVHDPVQENTAAIWALAITNGSKSLLKFTPIAKLAIEPKQVQSSLHGRRDLTQHFLYSAILHQLGETSLALSIGQLKELMDSDGGTGFSFADMTANKSGMALSSFATSNETNARLLQRRLSECNQESCIIPVLTDMVEGLDISSFEKRYSSVEDQEYLAVEQEIDKRIGSLPIYH